MDNWEGFVIRHFAIQDKRGTLFTFLSVFVLLQPVFDILTNFQVRAGQYLTIGTVVRALFMAGCFFYILVVGVKKRYWFSVVSCLLLAAYCLVFLVFCFARGGVHCVIGNMKEVIKPFYFPFILLAFYVLYKNYGTFLDKKILAYTAIIYTGVIFIAFITNTGSNSYGSSGYGNNGWFYAANEVGVTVGVLSAVTVCYFVSRIAQRTSIGKGQWFFRVVSFIALALVIFCSLFIGTKAVFLSVFGYLTCYFIWNIVHIKGEAGYAKKVQSVVTVFMCIVIGLLYFVSPLRANINGGMKYHYETRVESIQSGPSVSEELPDDKREVDLEKIEKSYVFRVVNWLLSDRLHYSLPVIQSYVESDLSGKLFGIGYQSYGNLDQVMEKSVEMDFLSIFFRHGIVGFLVYLIPLVYFLIRMFKTIFTQIRLVWDSVWYCTLCYAILLGLGIAFFAGHVLTAPAVSIYLAVLFVLAMQNSDQMWQLQEISKRKKE